VKFRLAPVEIQRAFLGYRRAAAKADASLLYYLARLGRRVITLNGYEVPSRGPSRGGTRLAGRDSACTGTTRVCISLRITTAPKYEGRLLPVTLRREGGQSPCFLQRLIFGRRQLHQQRLPVGVQPTEQNHYLFLSRGRAACGWLSRARPDVQKDA